MGRQTRRVVLGAFFALVVFAGPAAAECAWVLWEQHVVVKAADLWYIRNTYETKKECESGRTAWIQPEEKKLTEFRRAFGITDVRYSCLPDTLDPRGPKGGGQ